MKKIILVAAFLMLSIGLWAQKGKVGASVGIAGGTSVECLERLKKAGVEYIEVTMNPFWRNKPENEVYIRAYKALKNIETVGLKVWSVHLPFHEKGVVDWTAFGKNLKKIGYKGVFMFEVSEKHGKPEDLVPIYKRIMK